MPIKKKVLIKKSDSDKYGEFFAVGVAQLVEHQVVALVAAGSSPVTHPIVSLEPPFLGKAVSDCLCHCSEFFIGQKIKASGSFPGGKISVVLKAKLDKQISRSGISMMP